VSRGLFIAFEGIDGSGKSTHARRIARETGALFTFEPGDSELGVQLRELLLHSKVALTPETEALLMLSDRSHHVASIIAPTLAQGRAVIADRFLASTISYQGYGRGVDVDLLWRATDLAVGDLRPDLTIVFDLPVEVAARRRAPRDDDRFERSGPQFQERVRHGLLEMADGNPHYTVIDASGNHDYVAAQLTAALSAVGLV
jgi:dTMP kinase